jgi:MarR family transcriptional regulator, temperature-dependent positive regulator of motility
MFMFEYCLYFNTAALARTLEKAWAVAFLPLDLTPPQAFMLRVVLDQPGRSPSDLSRTMVISKPTATRCLDGLCAKGLVERRSSAADGRESSIYPTSAAVTIHEQLNRASGTVTQKLKRSLGGDGFQTAVTTVRDVRTLLE